jgi:hypothetical protein
MIKDNVFLSAVTSLRLKEYKLALSLLFYKVGRGPRGIEKHVRDWLRYRRAGVDINWVKVFNVSHSQLYLHRTG